MSQSRSTTPRRGQASHAESDQAVTPRTPGAIRIHVDTSSPGLSTDGSSRSHDNGSASAVSPSTRQIQIKPAPSSSSSEEQEVESESRSGSRPKFDGDSMNEETKVTRAVRIHTSRSSRSWDEDDSDESSDEGKRPEEQNLLRSRRRPLSEEEWNKLLGRDRPDTIYTGRMTYERAHAAIGGRQNDRNNTDYPPSHVLAPGDQILLAFPRKLDSKGQCVRTSGAPAPNPLMGQDGGDDAQAEEQEDSYLNQPLTLFLPSSQQLGPTHKNLIRSVFVILLLLIPLHVFLSIMAYLNATNADGDLWSVEQVYEESSIPFSLISCAMLLLGLFSADTLILGFYLVVGYLDAFVNLLRLRTGVHGGLFVVQLAMCQCVHRFRTAIAPRWRTL